MRRRLQNKIAESSATLPVAAVAATLLWWLPQGAYSARYLLGWVACALTAYALVETTAANALLRVRSRMVSSLFLFLMAASGCLHPLQASTAATLFLAAALHALLPTCQHPRPAPATFHAYLFVALASLCAPPLLLLAPLLLICQGVYLRSLDARSLRAALLGILFPYALWASVAAAADVVRQFAPSFLTFHAFTFQSLTLQSFISHLLAAADPVRQPLHALADGQTPLADVWQDMADAARQFTPAAFADYLLRIAQPHAQHLAALGVTVLTGITGGIHYLRKSYDDKTRVRMCHYTFLTLHAALLLWLLLQPCQLTLLLPLLMLTATPAAAHFVALTHTAWTNAWVVCLFLAIVALGVFTLR